MFGDALREVGSIRDLDMRDYLSLRGRESVPFLHPFKICLIGNSTVDQNIDIQKRPLASLNIPQHMVSAARFHIDWRFNNMLSKGILFHNRFVVETFFF